MIKVKKVFGIVMVAASMYFLKIVIPEGLYLFLTSVLLIMFSVFLGAFTKVDNKSAGFGEYAGKSLGVFMLIFLVSMVTRNFRFSAWPWSEDPAFWKIMTRMIFSVGQGHCLISVTCNRHLTHRDG